MRIEVDLNKRYLVFFGVIIVFALMGGVLAAVGHRVSEINWQEQVQGNVTLSESLVAQRGIAAAGGFCIGTNCITNWNQIGGSQWTAVGGAISYAGNINVNGLCIGGNCITQIKSATQSCPAGQRVSSIDFKSQTITCSDVGSAASCTDACTIPGSRVCSSTAAFKVCFYNSVSGCNELSSEIACTPAGTTCSNGACVSGGVCTPGQTQCVGTTGQQTCGSDSQWGIIVSCSAGWACDSAYQSCRALQWTAIGQVNGNACPSSQYNPLCRDNTGAGLVVIRDPYSGGNWYVYDTIHIPSSQAQVGSCTGTCTSGQYCLSSAPSPSTYSISCGGIANAQIACDVVGPTLYKCQ